MLTTLILALALQASPAAAPKTKLGLPADTRPIAEVMRQVFADPPDYKGKPFTLAQAREWDCQRAKDWTDLAARIKGAKIEGDIGTGGAWKELDANDMKALDLRLNEVEAKVEKFKLGCLR